MNETLLVIITTVVFYFIFKKILKPKPLEVPEDKKENSFQNKAKEMIAEKRKEGK